MMFKVIIRERGAHKGIEYIIDAPSESKLKIEAVERFILEKTPEKYIIGAYVDLSDYEFDITTLF